MTTSSEDFWTMLFVGVGLLVLAARAWRLYVSSPQDRIVAEGRVESVWRDTSRWYDQSVITFEDGATLRMMGDYRRTCPPGRIVRIEQKLLGGHIVREVAEASAVQT